MPLIPIPRDPVPTERELAAEIARLRKGGLKADKAALRHLASLAWQEKERILAELVARKDALR